MNILIANYPCYASHKDKEIIHILGRDFDSSGYYVGEGIRELEFGYKNKEEAVKAAELLLSNFEAVQVSFYKAE